MKLLNNNVKTLLEHIKKESTNLKKLYNFLLENVFYLEDFAVDKNTTLLHQSNKSIKIKFLEQNSSPLPESYDGTDKLFYILEGQVTFSIYMKEQDNRVSSVSSEIVGAGEIIIINRGEIHHLLSKKAMSACLLEINISDIESEEPIVYENFEHSPQELDSSYYYGYDERYEKVYEAGATTWETTEPNEPILKLENELDLNDKKIIDLGCGEGRDTLYLTKKGYNVLGVDVSRHALKKARQIARISEVEAKFLERDVVYLRGIESNQFDIALNMGCLHMISDSEHRKAHLNRVFDILKPGGLFFVAHCKDKWLEGFYSVPNYEEVGEVIPGKVIKRRIRVENGTKMIDLPLVPYKESSEEELINEASIPGFNVIKSFNENTDAFGNTVVLLLQKPPAGVF